jgi:hypothetical protein
VSDLLEALALVPSLYCFTAGFFCGLGFALYLASHQEHKHDRERSDASSGLLPAGAVDPQDEFALADLYLADQGQPDRI